MLSAATKIKVEDNRAHGKIFRKLKLMLNE